MNVGFKWLNPTEKLCAHTDFEDRYIYMVEVDLEYPRELHNLHDYPLEPENMVVSHKWFSNYQHELLDDYKDMLTPNLN